jgi:hypothetical protein
MKKISISHLRQIFHSPLQITYFKQQEAQPKLEIVPVKPSQPETDFQIEPKPANPVQKDDFSPFFLQTQIMRCSLQSHSSHEVLQMGFCCQSPNTKLLAINHTTELFDCFGKDKCPRKLIKVKIGEWS